MGGGEQEKIFLFFFVSVFLMELRDRFIPSAVFRNTRVYAFKRGTI